MYAPRKADDQVAVFSLRSEGSDPRDDAARLWSRDRLMVRAGLHCAPGAHRFIGTFPSGTYRFSFGPWTTARDVDRALRGLRRCAGAARSTFHVPGR